MVLHKIHILLLSAFSVYATQIPWTQQYTHIFSNPSTANTIIATNSDTKNSAFRQLIFSWNALRPSKGFFQFFVRARNRQTKRWYGWHKAAEWGVEKQRSFSNKNFNGSFYHHVRLELPRLADAFEIKVTARNGADLNNVKMISVTTSRLSALPPPSRYQLKKLTSTEIHGAPVFSQMVLPHAEAHRICSPTSLSMLVSYLLHANIDPMLFADLSFDEGLNAYGSWPFNIAHAFERVEGKYYFCVTRLPSFIELHALLKNNIPVVVSVRGFLQGAPKPYPHGHLILVVGYDAHKQKVIVHDPAQKNENAVYTTYTLHDFLTAWDRSHRLAYVAFKEKLPPCKSLEIRHG